MTEREREREYIGNQESKYKTWERPGRFAIGRVWTHPLQVGGIVGRRLCDVGMLLLAGMLATASFAKAMSASHLYDALYVSGLVPHPLARPAGIALIGTEMLTALVLLASLVIAPWRGAALRATLLLCASFAAYSLWRIWQGVTAPCGCLGTLFAASPLTALLLSTAMIAMASMLLAAPYAARFGKPAEAAQAHG